MGGSEQDKTHIISLKQTSFTLFAGPTNDYLKNYFQSPLSFEKQNTVTLETDSFSEMQEQLPISIRWLNLNDTPQIHSIDLFLQLQLPVYDQGFKKAYQHVARIEMTDAIDLPYKTRIRVHGNKPFRVIAVIHFSNGNIARLTTAEIPLRNCNTDRYLFVNDDHPLAGQSFPVTDERFYEIDPK